VVETIRLESGHTLTGIVGSNPTLSAIISQPGRLVMDKQPEAPFDSIENAKDYVRLLQETVADARQEIAADLAAASEAQSDRRLEALRVIHYKLEKLEQHLHSSSRTLNDLRSLRRLLFEERTRPASVQAESGPDV
jgi:hypothetical protein